MALARVWRKRFGGGMRQVGILAAAGLWALDHHVERLAEDHARARRFADAAAEALPGCVDPKQVETNIVVLDLSGSAWAAGDLVAAAAARGIRLYAVSGTAVRLVWHLDVDDAGTDRAVGEICTLLAAGPQTS
jgi:threonine aldolase